MDLAAAKVDPLYGFEGHEQHLADDLRGMQA